MARALESTLKYWLKSFSRDQFNGDALHLHATLGLPPAISATMAKVGKLEIMGSPCHLYSDLEFNIKENAEKNGDEMVDLLILIAFEALFDKYVRGYTMEEEGIKDLKYNSHVLSILKSSTSQVQTALKGSGGSKTGVSEGVEASIIYVRFKAAASELEHQQFDHFFPSTSEDISSLAPLVDPLCTFLYDTLRPKLIHETNLDGLCELVDILKIEVIGEHLSRRSESLAGIRPTLDRILADIYERLTFRARTHIRDEIANYSHWMKIWITLESWNNRLRPTQIPLL
ncbi:hypothetical protein LXL04_036104 [Taraxacum kok-saghyz]